MRTLTRLAVAALLLLGSAGAVLVPTLAPVPVAHAEQWCDGEGC